MKPRRNDTFKEYINFSAAESGIINKYKKICFSTLSEDRVFRNNCRLEGNEPVTSQKESNKSYGGNFKPFFKRPSFNKRIL